MLSAEGLREAILAGDDFVQWSLRFGLVLIDDGTLESAAELMHARRPWRDVARKREHAAKSLALALRVVASGDQDGALVQVRTGLSLAARAYLLTLGEFPLSRAELPDQLLAVGCQRAAEALRACIDDDPDLAALGSATAQGDLLLEAARDAALHHPHRGT